MFSESKKQILHEIVAASSARRVSHSVLFIGSNKSQATAAAKQLAKELQRDLHRVDLSKVVSKYIGETEKNLLRVFDEASKHESVLLFDEADALFGKRTAVKDSHDRYANAEINFLLQRLEHHQGLVILTTNEHEHLPLHFRGRFRFVVDFS